MNNKLTEISNSVKNIEETLNTNIGIINNRNFVSYIDKEGDIFYVNKNKVIYTSLKKVDEKSCQLYMRFVDGSELYRNRDCDKLKNFMNDLFK